MIIFKIDGYSAQSAGLPMFSMGHEKTLICGIAALKILFKFFFFKHPNDPTNIMSPYQFWIFQIINWYTLKF